MVNGQVIYALSLGRSRVCCLPRRHVTGFQVPHTHRNGPCRQQKGISGKTEAWGCHEDSDFLQMARISIDHCSHTMGGSFCASLCHSTLRWTTTTIGPGCRLPDEIEASRCPRGDASPWWRSAWCLPTAGAIGAALRPRHVRGTGHAPARNGPRVELAAGSGALDGKSQGAGERDTAQRLASKRRTKKRAGSSFDRRRVAATAPQLTLDWAMTATTRPMTMIAGERQRR